MNFPLHTLLSAGIFMNENMPCAGSEKKSRCENAKCDFVKKMICMECHEDQMTSAVWNTRVIWPTNPIRTHVGERTILACEFQLRLGVDLASKISFERNGFELTTDLTVALQK
jgi:hypothetical protein